MEDDYSALDDYPWPDDMYDELGQVDMERLMEILKSQPELMEQFQAIYGGGSDYDDESVGLMSTPTLGDLYINCIEPSVRTALDSIVPLLVACIICSLVARLTTTTRPMFSHFLFTVLGLLVLYRFFEENSAILVLYSAIACVLLLYKPLRRRVGVTLSTFTLTFAVACEFLIHPNRWHSVRGAQMVLSMKVISLGFDLSSESVKDISILETVSYLLHPGSVIFGPWIPYRYYIEGIISKKKWLDWKLMFQSAKTLTLSILYLLWSTCLLSHILPEHDSWGPWIDAYRDAQSFRFSHYFVCGLAETTLLLSGVAVFSSDGDLISSKSVSQPMNIELPRSLVEVVTSWNLPMHSWLKNYVFKVARPRWGTFAAILLTYVASSLLHGLNFQLAAVLLSLAMYHLAYLGVMFDTSEVEQERGYSMAHTLSKWDKLGYSSHIIAFLTFIFYWLIK